MFTSHIDHIIYGKGLCTKCTSASSTVLFVVSHGCSKKVVPIKDVNFPRNRPTLNGSLALPNDIFTCIKGCATTIYQMDQFFDKIYIINLESSKARRASMEEQLERLGVKNYIMFPATPAATLNREKLMKGASMGLPR